MHYDQVAIIDRLCDGLEAQEGIGKHFAAANRNVNVNPPHGVAEYGNDIGLDNLGPEWQEGRGAAIHHEHCVFPDESIHQCVIAVPLQDTAGVDEFQFFYRKGSIARIDSKPIGPRPPHTPAASFKRALSQLPIVGFVLTELFSTFITASLENAATIGQRSWPKISKS